MIKTGPSGHRASCRSLVTVPHPVHIVVYILCPVAKILGFKIAKKTWFCVSGWNQFVLNCSWIAVANRKKTYECTTERGCPIENHRNKLFYAHLTRTLAGNKTLVPPHLVNTKLAHFGGKYYLFCRMLDLKMLLLSRVFQAKITECSVLKIKFSNAMLI